MNCKCIIMCYYMCIFMYFIYALLHINYVWVNFMGNIAFHKKNNKDYVQYTVRFESSILNSIKEIASKEDMPINEVINQSLKFSIDNYNSQDKK